MSNYIVEKRFFLKCSPSIYYLRSLNFRPNQSRTALRALRALRAFKLAVSTPRIPTNLEKKNMRHLTVIGIVFILFLSISSAEAREPKTVSKITVEDTEGNRNVFRSPELTRQSQSLPEGMSNFPQQKFIPINTLIDTAEIEEGKEIQFVDSEGKVVRFSYKEVTSGEKPLALISTFAGTWKLVDDTISNQAYKSQEKIRPINRKYMRSLAKIIISNRESSQLDSEDCSNPKVYLDLDSALKNKERACVLNLNGQNLDAIPEDVFQLSNLRELHLGRNQLQELPKEIAKLSKLKKLIAGRNKLNTLPSEIGALQELEILKLGRNSISSLPAEIGRLQRLTKLELDNNSLKSVPAEVGEMTSLKELELASNPIEELPQSIKKLKALEEVELSRATVSAAAQKKIKAALSGVNLEWN